MKLHLQTHVINQLILIMTLHKNIEKKKYIQDIHLKFLQNIVHIIILMQIIYLLNFIANIQILIILYIHLKKIL